jgi:hypothetical protein
MQMHRKLCLAMMKFFTMDVRPLRSILINVRSKQQLSYYGLKMKVQKAQCVISMQNITYIFS